MAAVRIVLDGGKEVVNYRLTNTDVQSGNAVLKALVTANGGLVLLENATGESLLINSARLVMAQVES